MNTTAWHMYYTVPTLKIQIR